MIIAPYNRVHLIYPAPPIAIPRFVRTTRSASRVRPMTGRRGGPPYCARVFPSTVVRIIRRRRSTAQGGRTRPPTYDQASCYPLQRLEPVTAMPLRRSTARFTYADGIDMTAAHIVSARTLSLSLDSSFYCFLICFRQRSCCSVNHCSR